MNIDNIEIKVDGTEVSVTSHSTLLEISKLFNNTKHETVIAKVNGRYHDLNNLVEKGDEVEFLDLSDTYANRVYINGLCLLFKYAYFLVSKDSEYDNKAIMRASVDDAQLIYLFKPTSKEEVKEISKKMKEIVDSSLSITRVTVTKDEAISYFEHVHNDRTAQMLKFTASSYVHLYKIGNMYEYILSKMPVDTSCLKEFELEYHDEHTIFLKAPTIYDPDHIAKLDKHPLLEDLYRDCFAWRETLGIVTSANINEVVSLGKIDDLIRVNEGMQSSMIFDLAKKIANTKGIKIVLMAGPSSSGKTTSCNRLSGYLQGVGMKPHRLSMDDFFKDRIDTPLKPDGSFDFECLEALDLKLFNKTVDGLLSGKEMTMPTFNFIIGEKEFRTKMKLKENDILLIEGIHALNPKLLPDIPKDKKFKVYVSPFTTLPVDDFNRVSTCDNRLLRRIVRDSRTRGYKVTDTLKVWPSVREGEEKYIFPYQDEANYYLETSMLYEMNMLSTFVLPLLYAVERTDPYYDEARRLIKILKHYLAISSEGIPADSTLREFCGGSCFY